MPGFQNQLDYTLEQQAIKEIYGSNSVERKQINRQNELKELSRKLGKYMEKGEDPPNSLVEPAIDAMLNQEFKMPDARP